MLKSFILASSVEGKESQYIYNGRGSVVKELQDKKEVATYQYGDYGELVKGKPEQDCVYGYNGENYNSVTELTYLRARYYDPKIGRFIQIDRNYEGENKDSVSQNRYAYTLNNPYKYIDKDGNKNTYNPNGFGYENVTSAYSDAGADLIIKKNKNKSLSEFEKKIKGFTKTQKARAMKAWNDANNLKNYTNKVIIPSLETGKALPGQTQPNKPANNGTNSTGVGTKPTPTAPKPTPPKTLTNVKVECPTGTLLRLNQTEIVRAIEDEGNNVYKAYENKYDDSGLLEAIKKEIDKVLDKGKKDQDLEYVKTMCESYKIAIKVPAYSTDDGAYVSESYVSLKNSTITNSFVSDVSGTAPAYTFKLITYEYCSGGFGFNMTAVTFKVSLPWFSKECIKVKLSVNFEFWSISISQQPLSFLKFEEGIYLGVGINAGFSFDTSNSKLELVGQAGIAIGLLFKITLDIKKLIT